MIQWIVEESELPKCPQIIGSWMRIWVPMGTDHNGPLCCQCQVQLDELGLWLGIWCSLLKHLMTFACITDSPTSLNIKSWSEKIPAYQLGFPSGIFLFTESPDLTTYKSLEYLSIWCEIKCSYESYLWMVTWFDNPPLSRICKEKLMVLFFGLQLTSCNLQCIEQYFPDLNLTWSNGSISFQTRVSPSEKKLYDNHRTGMGWL